MAMNIKVDSEKQYAQGFHYVVKKQGEIVADVVGTCHFGEKPFSELNPAIKTAALKAKTIGFENVVSDQQTSTVRSCLSLNANKIKEWYADFNDKNYDQTKAYKYPGSSVNKEEAKQYQKYGTEALILRACKNKSVDMVSLESAEQHAEAVLSIKEWEQRMAQKLSNGTISEGEIIAVNADDYDAYRKGNENLEKQVMEWWKCQDPAFDYYVRRQRNEIFAKKAVVLITRADPQNRVVVAIGCKHILGEDGVPKLLEQQLGNGYSIMPYK